MKQNMGRRLHSGVHGVYCHQGCWEVTDLLSVSRTALDFTLDRSLSLELNKKSKLSCLS